ncbi:cysteine--tRNA ligase [Guggenheimella bovis]
MKLYDTMTQKLEEIKPLHERFKIYTCGPTVYNYAHIGNLRTYVNEDILVRALEYLGYGVDRGMNITDVGHLESDADSGDDKMLKGAKRENKTVWEIAEYYMNAFFRDFDAMKLKRPTRVERATDHIQEFIDFILVLEEKGYAYRSGGNVYFDISKFPDYNKLSKMPLDQLQLASRHDVKVDEAKKNPLDFALWFTKSKFDDQEMKWDSPFGYGYPGWHIECSVLSMIMLGETLDIHCGGVDHIPTHHTNEIAQSESYTGKPWVNHWYHAEFLIEKDGKMSKSKGEFLHLTRLIELGYDPMHYKYFLLGSHYRKQLLFSYDSMDQAKEAYKKLKEKTLRLPAPQESNKHLDDFKAALSDDLNTANALTVIYDILKDDSMKDEEKRYELEEIESVLNLGLFEEDEVTVDVERVEELIQERLQAKAQKNFERADAIREELKAMGVIIMDSKDKTTWKTM